VEPHAAGGWKKGGARYNLNDTMLVCANVLPSDVYNSNAVAMVSGLSGTGSGIGTIIAMKAVGYLSDARISDKGQVFDPIVLASGIIPVIGMVLVLLLVRNTRATREGLVRPV
jgi:MFS transporter, ACS family, aldohexuronate transporter